MLDTGTAQEIDAAKEAYIRQYKATWRKNKRAESKSVTIAFTKSEYASIKRAAKNSTPTAFCHAAAIHFGKQVALGMDPESVGEIREILRLTYHQIRAIGENNSDQTIKEYSTAAKVEELERVLLEYFQKPKSLEAVITEAIQNDPDKKQQLLTLLNSM